MSEPVEFPALVVDVRLESRTAGQARWQIALDRTEFRAGDTGDFEAVARSGARLQVEVLEVDVDRDGTVWHVVEKPLTEGTKITATVRRQAGSLLH